MRDGAATAAMAVRRESQVSLHLSVVLFATYVFLARLTPELRYTRYFLPAALAVLWLARRAQGDRVKVLQGVLVPFAVVTAAVCLWSAVVIGTTSTFYPRFFEETLFLVAPLGAAMIWASLKREDSDWPFFALVGILTVDYLWEIGPTTIVDELRRPLAFATDLFRSSAPTESVRAFSFGLLAIFFLGRRRWLGAALCVLLAVLGGKRIVLLGLIVAVPLAALPALDRKRFRVVITAVAIALNLMTALSLRNLDDWGIAERIQEATLRSANEVLMGRATLYALLTDRLPDTPLVGAGLGRITHVLEAENAWLTNTHSDILKHFLELGPFMFAVWIGCFYWMTRSKGALALVVYMNVLFLSDNVAIYFDVMFPFYLSLLYLHGWSAAAATPVTEVRRRPTCTTTTTSPVSQAA